MFIACNWNEDAFRPLNCTKLCSVLSVPFCSGMRVLAGGCVGGLAVDVTGDDCVTRGFLIAELRELLTTGGHVTLDRLCNNNDRVRLDITIRISYSTISNGINP